MPRIMNYLVSGRPFPGSRLKKVVNDKTFVTLPKAERSKLIAESDKLLEQDKLNRHVQWLKNQENKKQIGGEKEIQ